MRGGRGRLLAGVGFVGCFVAAALLYGSGAGSEQAAVTAYYEHHAWRQVAGFAVLLAGCVCLLVFVVEISGEDVLARLSGVSAVVLLAVGNALWAATAFTVELERGYHPTASSHLLVEDAGWIAIVSAAAVAIPLVWRVPLVPRWFRAVIVLGLAAAYWYVPLALFLVWTLVTAARRSTGSQRPA